MSLLRSLTNRLCNSLALGWLLILVPHLTAQTPPQMPPQQPYAGPAPAQPGAAEVMLVKNALTAANHAVITGNFTVLRDLGSASFRQKNSAGDLAQIFKGLKSANVDLSPILVLNPQFTQQPAVNQAGLLRLVGYFPTQPLQVRFALAYQKTDAGWVLEAISVGAIDPRKQVSQPQPQSQPNQQPHPQSVAPANMPAHRAPYPGVPAPVAPAPVATRPAPPPR